MDSEGESQKYKQLRRPSEISVHAAGQQQQQLPSASSASEDAPVCWICLGEQPGLIRPCACPRFAHAHCLARWQLQSAGSRRETHCEFCDQLLPDWKKTLTPTCGASAPAVMNVNFDGRTYSFEVRPGPEGYQQFTEAIRRAFSLPEDSELNITFTCDEPTSIEPIAALPLAPPPPPPIPPSPVHYMDPGGVAGSLLTLQGAGAYDAAVHCASVSAARRMLQQRYMSDILPLTGGPQFRQDAMPGTPLSAAAAAVGAGGSEPAPTQGAITTAEGRLRKRLPAAFSRKLRNFCDMLSLGK